MNEPLINILTRTSNRPNAFKRCYDSIHNQTYKNIRHLVSYDDVKDLNYLNNYKNIDLCKINKLKLIYLDESKNPNTGKYSPHNLYFNEMHKFIKEGWVMYLDDDDYLANETVLEEIVSSINPNTDFILWQMKFVNGNLIPSNDTINDKPKLGNIGSPCVMFKYNLLNNTIWDGYKCADFRFIYDIYNKSTVKKIIKKPMVIVGQIGDGNKGDV